MGNQWFKFKQFEIQQDRCAMKVGTDGVILGAWTDVLDCKKALDVGTGTGLLSLMLAQRNSNLLVDAIEIDIDSALQASSNFGSSKFSDRIQCKERSFQDHCLHYGEADYDLIICNPPYFTSSLKSPGSSRNLARHDDSLPLSELFAGVEKVLKKSGRLSLILPTMLYPDSTETAYTHGLFPWRKLLIQTTPGKESKRVCVEYRSLRRETFEETLVIEEGMRHKYSAEYSELTKDFYL